MRRVLTTVRARLRSRRVLAAIGTIVVLLVGASSGAAYAYFSTSGAGSSTASTGQPMTVHVIPTTATPTNTLIPGGSSDLVLTMNNPNSYPVTIVAVDSNGAGPDAGGGCTAANSGVTIPTQTGLSIAVASGSSVDVTIPSGATMSSSSASACQGKRFELPILLTVKK